jgi:hypothetical protein
MSFEKCIDTINSINILEGQFCFWQLPEKWRLQYEKACSEQRCALQNKKRNITMNITIYSPSMTVGENIETTNYNELEV